MRDRESRRDKIYNRFATKKLNYMIITQDNINNNNIKKNYKWFKQRF